MTSLHELRCETPTVPLVCEPPFDFYDNFFSVLFFFFLPIYSSSVRDGK